MGSKVIETNKQKKKGEVTLTSIYIKSQHGNIII